MARPRDQSEGYDRHGEGPVQTRLHWTRTREDKSDLRNHQAIVQPYFGAIDLTATATIRAADCRSTSWFSATSMSCNTAALKREPQRLRAVWVVPSLKTLSPPIERPRPACTLRLRMEQPRLCGLPLAGDRTATIGQLEVEDCRGVCV